MQITPIKTPKIKPNQGQLIDILDQYLPDLAAGTVLAITSKLVGLCQNAVVVTSETDRTALIQSEAEAYLPAHTSRHLVLLTIKGGLLSPNAGVDESNSAGTYVCWPRQPQETANAIRAYLHDRFGHEQLGVVITDSSPMPLRWGVTGVAIAHSGFLALNNYMGKADLFGRPLQMTQANIRDGLAAAAVLVMGEGAEQTPLATIDDVPFVQFQNRDPSPAELQALQIALADDLFAPLLTAVSWLTGGSSTL